MNWDMVGAIAGIAGVLVAVAIFVISRRTQQPQESQPKGLISRFWKWLKPKPRIAIRVINASCNLESALVREVIRTGQPGRWTHTTADWWVGCTLELTNVGRTTAREFKGDATATLVAGEKRQPFGTTAIGDPRTLEPKTPVLVHCKFQRIDLRKEFNGQWENFWVFYPDCDCEIELQYSSLELVSKRETLPKEPITKVDWIGDFVAKRWVDSIGSYSLGHV